MNQGRQHEDGEVPSPVHVTNTTVLPDLLVDKMTPSLTVDAVKVDVNDSSGAKEKEENDLFLYHKFDENCKRESISEESAFIKSQNAIKWVKSPSPFDEVRVKPPIPFDEARVKSPSPFNELRVKSLSPCNEVRVKSPNLINIFRAKSPSPIEIRVNSPSLVNEVGYESFSPVYEMRVSHQEKSPCCISETRIKSPSFFNDERVKSPSHVNEVRYKSFSPLNEAKAKSKNIFDSYIFKRVQSPQSNVIEDVQSPNSIGNEKVQSPENIGNERVQSPQSIENEKVQSPQNNSNEVVQSPQSNLNNRVQSPQIIVSGRVQYIESVVSEIEKSPQSSVNERVQSPQNIVNENVQSCQRNANERVHTTHHKVNEGIKSLFENEETAQSICNTNEGNTTAFPGILQNRLESSDVATPKSEEIDDPTEEIEGTNIGTIHTHIVSHDVNNGAIEEGKNLSSLKGNSVKVDGDVTPSSCVYFKCKDMVLLSENVDDLCPVSRRLHSDTSVPNLDNTDKTKDIHLDFSDKTEDVHLDYSNKTEDVHLDFSDKTEDVHLDYSNKTEDVHLDYSDKIEDVHLDCSNKTEDVHLDFIDKTEDIKFDFADKTEDANLYYTERTEEDNLEYTDTSDNKYEIQIESTYPMNIQIASISSLQSDKSHIFQHVNEDELNPVQDELNPLQDDLNPLQDELNPAQDVISSPNFPVSEIKEEFVDAGYQDNLPQKHPDPDLSIKEEMEYSRYQEDNPAVKEEMIDQSVVPGESDHEEFVTPNISDEFLLGSDSGLELEKRYDMSSNNGFHVVVPSSMIISVADIKSMQDKNSSCKGNEEIIISDKSIDVAAALATAETTDETDSLLAPVSFACAVCHRGYATVVALKRHERCHQTEEPEAAVPPKKKVKMTRAKPRQIVELDETSMVTKQLEVYTCTCGMGFKRRSSAVACVRTHFVPSVFSCQHCQCAFKKREQLKCHFLRTHKRLNSATGTKMELDRRPSADTHRCSQCDKIFAHRKSLLRHVNNTHEKTKYSKTRAGRGGGSSRRGNLIDLTVAVENAKTKVDEIDLDISSLSTDTPTVKEASLVGGDEVEERIKFQFNCRKCTKGFLTLATLSLHHKTHHKKQAKTSSMDDYGVGEDGDNTIGDNTDLDISSISPHVLNQHVKTPTTVKDERTVYGVEEKIKFQFNCRKCTKSFLTLATLSLHHKTHHKKQVKKVKFPCERCKETFPTRSELSSHRRLHCRGVLHHYSASYILHRSHRRKKADRDCSESRPPPLVKCDVCGKEYATNRLMEEHRDTTHPFLTFSKDGATETRIFFK